ncbi:MAG: 2-oxo acid dehydrogenase subunit E2 [Candidatus Neomarinimicrobiota bacterium]|nr:MAG: 2-oxo acid dehydrogenase subunit E2 [Candidatus Neomarinimicrobiota bacterium]
MLVDIVMPKMGESITEGTILEWRKQVGDRVEKDEILLEIGTDKVDSEIPSPYSGVITEILAEKNEVVDVGVPIARVETEGDVSAAAPEEAEPEQEPAAEVPPPDTTPGPAPTRSKPAAGKRFYTPVVLKIAAEHGLDQAELETIPGSGRQGRVTKKDILAYLDTRTAAKPAATVPIPTPSPEGADLAGDRIVEMDHMRKRIARHMRASVDTAAHVYVTTEVDMSGIVAFMLREGDTFRQREGFSLTVTPFILRAVIGALQTFPEMNASLSGDEIHYHRNINLGLAVAVEKGLLVPVIPRAEELNFLGLCRRVRDLAQRARSKQISPDELQGSTFSVTNFGVFHVQMGTPIINQPNVGILGVGAITKRPVVLELEGRDVIGIRSMMIVSLGFDHRLIDGAGGSRFIEQVRLNLETMDLQHLF